MRGLINYAASFLVLASVTLAAAPDTATRTVVAQAQVSSRTSLVVSSQMLQFTVPDHEHPAVVAIDFVAGIRTHAGAEVVLTVETVLAENLPRESAITFSGEGDAGMKGAIAPRQSAVAARWMGSGRRTGRIAFELHSSGPGIYTIPVRFVLSAP